MSHNGDGVDIRNYRPEDLTALAALINEADEHDRLERARAVERLEREMTVPGFYPETDCFLAWAGDRLVGHADLILFLGEGEATVDTWGVVHPEWRRRGLGMRLVKALYHRGEERMGEVPAGPVYFHCGMDVREKGRQALFEAFGMAPARYFVNMACPLNGSLAAVQVPAGYRLRSFDMGRDVETMCRLFNVAFRDHWGYGEHSLEEFVHERINVRTFRPELQVMAEDEASGQVVGCTYNRIDPDWIAMTGRQEGQIATLAVLREARRRGLGSALLLESMRVLGREGAKAVHLYADADNLTGAVRIYERAGFAVRKSSIVYRKLMRAA